MASAPGAVDEWLLPSETLTCHKALETHARKDVYPWLILYACALSGLAHAYLSSEELYSRGALAWLALLLLGALAHASLLVSTYWSVKAYAFARLGPNDPSLLLDRKKNVVICIWVESKPPSSAAADLPTGAKPSLARSVKRSKVCPVTYVEKKQDEQTYARIDVDKFVLEALVYPTHETIRFRALELPAPATLLAAPRGLTSSEASERLAYYGKNEFALEDPKVEDFLWEQLMSPFFLFQLFCMILWMLDEYWYFALFTLVMLVVFEVLTAQNRKRSATMLRSTVRSPSPVHALRDGEWQLLSSALLVPGDWIRVPQAGLGGRDEEDLLFPCDAWLISGVCAMNEAMLTGESTPRAKEASVQVVASESSSQKEQDRHVLFGGTSIVSAAAASEGGASEKEPTAIVLRTGYRTVQGDLMRTILFSSDRVTVENEEAYVFMGILVVVAALAALYVLYEGLEDPKRNKYKLMLHCIMIITSVVPPELPIELSLSVTTSLTRLIRESSVYCTEPHRIPFAGRLDVCAFDKTGTLTSDVIAMYGVFNLQGEDAGDLVEVRRCLRYCHEALFHAGAWLGSPTDRAMINGYHAKYAAAPASGDRALVHRVFPFDSDVKRMSVLVSANEQLCLLTKGAPEVVLELLADKADRAAAYRETCRGFLRRGFRVLALARRSLKPEWLRQSRQELETQLEFLAFLVLENPLKPDTLSVITELRDSGHRSIMLTGDNPLTAAEVAARVGMRADKILTGNELNVMDDTTLALAVQDCDVFARVNPAQKERVMITLKGLGLGTLMCGDGTNDVGALKQADVGISVINESESATRRLARQYGEDSNYGEDASSARVKLGDASLASPFTARTSSLRCVVDVVRQGRCSLVTYLQMFKILACNGLLSSFSMTVLYLRGVKQGDTQGVVGGLLIAVAFALLSFAKPKVEISLRRPARRVFSPPVLASIAGQSAIHLVALINTLPPLNPEEEDTYSEDFKPNQVNTVVFLMGLTIHAMIYLVNYRGHPFMESVVENKPIGGVIAAIFLTGTLLTQGSKLPSILLSFLELVPVQNESKLLGWMLLDGALALSWEEVVVRRLLGG